MVVGGEDLVLRGDRGEKVPRPDDEGLLPPGRGLSVSRHLASVPSFFIFYCDSIVAYRFASWIVLRMKIVSGDLCFS